MTGQQLSVDDLINLKYAKNELGEYVDPVTYKVFTNNSHIVAIKNTGNVFAYDTVERLNIKAKNWIDLVSGDEFLRKDIITLQDPHNLGNRNLSSFKYIQEGMSIMTPEQERARSASVNASALGNAKSMIEDKSPELLKPSVGKYLERVQSKSASNKQLAPTPVAKSVTNGTSKPPSSAPTAKHTTGKAAASLTSTGLTPHTSSTLATLSSETALLKPRKIKQMGYATLHTTHGNLTLELHPYFSPKAVWNFITLSKRGYYDDVLFHRNIPSFMLQGGDPTSSGRGGQSAWGKDGESGPFEDEWANAPQIGFDKRGVLAMANKGKNTNTSQFFVTYRQAPHLNRKHTIFGRAVLDEGEESHRTLKRIEGLGDKDGKSNEEIRIKDVVVFVDPFEVYMEEEQKKEDEKEGNEEDEHVTWTGKRLRGHGEDGPGVGKYLGGGPVSEKMVEEWEVAAEEPVKKKKVRAGGGGFGNFDSW